MNTTITEPSLALIVDVSELVDVFLKIGAWTPEEIEAFANGGTLEGWSSGLLDALEATCELESAVSQEIQDRIARDQV